jgi:hypothetical protein
MKHMIGSFNLQGRVIPILKLSNCLFQISNLSSSDSQTLKCLFQISNLDLFRSRNSSPNLMLTCGAHISTPYAFSPFSLLEFSLLSPISLLSQTHVLGVRSSGRGQGPTWIGYELSYSTKCIFDS